MRCVLNVRTYASGICWGVTMISVSDRNRFGRVYAYSAAPTRPEWPGVIAIHQRLRTMRRMSSGVYFLPGSMGSR